MTEGSKSALFAQKDAASLLVHRALFGLILFGAMLRLIVSGDLEPQWAEPAIHFKYPGFSWVPGWSEVWMYYAHAGVVALLALMLAAGVFHRAAALLFAVGFAWLELIDVTNYLNHYYLVVLMALVLCVLPLGSAWKGPQTVPAWALYLVRFQVFVVYFNAGLAKFGTDWLLHAQPLGIWMSARTETPLIGPLLDEPLVAYAMSWAGFLFDTTIVLWLSLKRTRPIAYAAVVVFHFFTHVFFDIGIFPFVMVAGALIFFPPEWPRKLAGLAPVLMPRTASAAWTPGRRGAFALAMVWCLFHLGFPLRHYAYPGDVIWNEEGMRWSWKVMLREKNGSVTYRVRSAMGGGEFHVNPAQFLTFRQMNEMAAQPDLILQMARHVARHAQAQGVRSPEVRVDAFASLNGRPAQRLIDPDVDLLKVHYGFDRAAWILPEPTTPPLDVFAPRRAQQTPSYAVVP